MLNYKGTESGVGHEDDYPLNFVEETDELPCSKVLKTITSTSRDGRGYALSWENG